MDKYEVIGTLGEGSFGRVYKAKQLSTQTFVALKVISKVNIMFFSTVGFYIKFFCF